MDDGKVTAVTLLDFSYAFDTIDHTILLKRLADWFGWVGRHWTGLINQSINHPINQSINQTSIAPISPAKPGPVAKSHLTGRSQRMKLGNCLSSKSDLSVGVSHESVLGPLLFTFYTTQLSGMILGHAIPHHLYADDSQLYISFSSGNSAAAMVYNPAWPLSSHGCRQIN